MGSTTADLLIWTPDENDLAEPDVYLKTMAQSIEDNAGTRLRLQEAAVGLKAGIPAGTGIPVTAATAPYAVTAANGNFTQGLTISGGVVTVATPGMYIVTASLGIQPKNPADRTAAVDLYKGNTKLAGAELLQSVSYYITSFASCVVNCVAGDTLYVKWHSAAPAGVNTDATMAADTALTQFTVAMIQAVPT
jgi:hypothetical protein